MQRSIVAVALPLLALALPAFVAQDEVCPVITESSGSDPNAVAARQLSAATGEYILAAFPSTHGESVVFAGNWVSDENPRGAFQVFEIDATTLARTQHTRFELGISWLNGELEGRSLSASDDLEWLAVVTEDDLTGDNPDHSPELFVLRADGSSVTQLTDGPAGSASFRAVRMNGDGTGVLFVTARDLGLGGVAGSLQLCWIERDGNGLRRLNDELELNGFHVDIDDAGSRAIFSAGSNFADRRVYGVPTFGGGPRLAENEGTLKTAPDARLAGNGAWIALSRLWGLHGLGSLWFVSFSEGGPETEMTLGTFFLDFAIDTAGSVVAVMRGNFGRTNPDLDAEVWLIDWNAPSLRVEGGTPTEIRWDLDPRTQGGYDVIRGDLASLRFGGEGEETVELGPVVCLASNLHELVTVDPTTGPASGEAVFYLLRPLAGSFGLASNGAERVADLATCE